MTIARAAWARYPVTATRGRFEVIVDFGGQCNSFRSSRNGGWNGGRWRGGRAGRALPESTKAARPDARAGSNTGRARRRFISASHPFGDGWGPPGGREWQGRLLAAAPR